MEWTTKVPVVSDYYFVYGQPGTKGVGVRWIVPGENSGLDSYYMRIKKPESPLGQKKRTIKKQDPIIIKSYDKEKQFQKDAARMVEYGYEVLAVSKQRKRLGLGRVIMTGGLGVIIRKQEFTVTYQLAK